MIYIIGGTNIDVLIKINNNAILKESNPAVVSYLSGGVGRNIASTISNFKKCEFITSIPDKDEYHKILRELNDKNVRTDRSKLIPNSYNSTYLSVVDNNGLVIGAADMNAIDELKCEDVKDIIKDIKEDDYLILDANLSFELIDYVLNNSKGFKIFDAVSSVKLEKVKSIVNKFDLIKVNNYEYEIIKNEKLKNFLITYGNKVKLVYDGKTYELSHKLLEAKNPNGCGDAFLSGFIAFMDKGIKEALKMAVTIGASCSQTEFLSPSIEDIKKINESDLDIIWKE